MRTLVERPHRGAQSTAELAGPRAGRPGRRRRRPEHATSTSTASAAAPVMAAELQARLYRIGINAHAWSEVHVGLTSAALLGDASVAIAISNTGRTEETIEMLALAKSSGAYAVAVTSDPASPMAAGRRRPPDQPRAGRVPPARRPVGQARPALRARPALPPRRPTGLLAYDEPAGGLRSGRRAASPSASLGDRGRGPCPRRKEPPQHERTSRATSPPRSAVGSTTSTRRSVPAASTRPST